MNKIFKTLYLFLILVAIILLIIIVKDKTSFPIKLIVCDISYEDCSTIARLDDMDSCQIIQERHSWYCDIVTNPLKPDCRVEKSNISTSYCSK